MNTKQSFTVIRILITSLIISGCGPEQLFNTTQTSTPSPTFIQVPTLTETTTPTMSITPAPTFTPTPIPTLPPGVSNLVHVDFFNSFRFHSVAQAFINREVKGFLHNSIHLQNTPDESSAPVYGLGLELSTEPGVIQRGVREEYLEILGPPVFKWFFGNVPEEPIQDVYMSEAYFEPGGSFGALFTPGFDASISVDKMRFSEPDAQVVILTIVPRQDLYNPSFIFHLGGGTYGGAADVVITSLDLGEHRGPAGERITVTPDRKNIGVDDLSLTINEPYSFSMTLRVDPHQLNTKYEPYLGIAWLPGESIRGTELGNMLTVPIDKVGIWTWTAIGEYLWEWQGPGTQYEVSFN